MFLLSLISELLRLDATVFDSKPGEEVIERSLVHNLLRNQPNPSFDLTRRSTV